MPIRPASNADGTVIRDVVFTVLREFGLRPDPQDTDADLADIEAHYITRGGDFSLLEIEGKIVGTVGVYPLEAARCELRKMYLLPSHRGQGWGRRLAEHALSRARTLGFQHMQLETATPLKDAIALYEKLGFKPIPDSGGCHDRCDQMYERPLD